jgi:16S rRNA (guanine966-N2)-methyltransferase
LRIIGGTAKGRRIKIPSNPKFRPTSDRARETLFNIIRNDIAGSLFFDFFAGSGAVGLEAVSRGSAGVVSIEKDRRNCGLIKENFETAGYLDMLTLKNRDAIRALSSIDCPEGNRCIFFFDPPYYQGYYPKIIEKLTYERDSSNTIIIIEHPTMLILDPGNRLEITRLSRIGDTCFSFLRFINPE